MDGRKTTFLYEGYYIPNASSVVRNKTCFFFCAHDNFEILYYAKQRAIIAAIYWLKMRLEGGCFPFMTKDGKTKRI